MYILYEQYPCVYGTMYKSLLTFDNKSDAKDVLALLTEMDYNFTCYVIMKRPFKWKLV